MFNGGVRWAVLAVAIGVVGVVGARAVANAAERSADVGAAAATTVVRTKAELVAALARAAAGDTVFVDGAASIDLTGLKRIVIPAGVTLASDRGQSGAAGALLYNDELDLGDPERWAQFSTTGSGVRVTGLRLRGPDREVRDNAYQYDNSSGIEAIGASDLLVDNNELYGWSHSAVYLGDTIEGRVRGNNFHHNRRTGLGYGVVLVNDASAVIEDNRFSQNRHAIAGSGIRTQRYEARFNLVIDDAASHSFDMHGENEALDNGAAYAGDVIHIHHNSFRSTAQPGVVLRGRPATGAWVSGNCFAHGSAGSAIVQKNFTGNLSTAGNTYGTTSGTCHQTGRRIGWRLSSGGTGSYSDLASYTFGTSEIGFGDFDGDGRTDVFRATGYRWYYSPAGTGAFVPAALAGTRLPELRFGDFDGDGRTDVFRTSAGQWSYSSGAVGTWQPLASSGAALESLRFGDFDGDGRTDVFQTVDGKWRFSSGGKSSWTNLNSAAVPLESLRFGDFDGDRRTDVFSVAAGQWRFSPGGVGPWRPLATSGAPLDTLRFGDFDGDGRTDVFQTLDGQWSYSSAGRSNWIAMARSGCPLSGLHVADDFTGDGKADVFDGRCGD